MADRAEYEKILDSRTGLLILVGTILFMIPLHATGVLGFVMLFSAFDIIGFGRADQGRGSAAYRILQVMFQVVLTYALSQHAGLVTAAAATIAWYLLVCDVLYYWAMEIKLDAFSWFHSSPVVFLFQRILKRPAAPAWSVLASAIIGLVLAMSLTFIF